MASKKKVDKKAKTKAKNSERKPRDSVASFIKDELNAGKSDVAKIVQRAKANYPDANPTPGYVRFIAKQIGKSKQVASTRSGPKAKPAAKPAKAKKKSDKKPKDPAPSSDGKVDPAS